MGDFKTWFVAERAKALALVLLTRRDDLIIKQTKEETGLDFTVSIRSEDEPGLRPFGVLMRATMTPVTVEQANAQLKPTMGSAESLGPFQYPVCVFYFTVKEDQGFYTWAYEPVITEGGDPKLKAHHDAHCAELNDETLAGIITSVNAWYGALFATLAE